MKLNLKVQYLLLIAAIAMAVNLIPGGPAVILCIPLFAGIILFDRITQRLYKQGKSFLAAEIIFSAVYAVYASLCLAGRLVLPFIILLTAIAAFLCITINRQIYFIEKSKLPLTYTAEHQRNFIFILLLSINKNAFENVFIILFIACTVFFVYDVLATKSEYRPHENSKGISNELIVLVDIRDFAYMPGLLRKASLRTYPRLKMLLKKKLPNSYKGIAIKYGNYRRAQAVYDTIWNKKLIICCDNFELYTKDVADVLCNIAEEFRLKNFNVFFIINTVTKSNTVKIYHSIVQRLGNTVCFIEGKDIPMNMELSEYLSENLKYTEKVEHNTEKLITNAPVPQPRTDNTVSSPYNMSYNQVNTKDSAEQRGTDTSFSREKAKQRKHTSSIIRSAQIIYFFVAAISRAPWSDLLTNFIFSFLSKKRNSWLYGAIKKYYNMYQIIVYGVAVLLNCITMFYIFLSLQPASGSVIVDDDIMMKMFFAYFIITPIQHIAVAAVYLLIMWFASPKAIDGLNKYKKLIINMDISDIMRVDYMAVPSYNYDLVNLDFSGTEYIDLQNNILSVNYLYFIQYEKILSQISDKSIIIHAEKDYFYYDSIKKIDLCREVDALRALGLRVYIHTDYPETYPNLSNCIIIGGKYFECIRSVMMSADNVGTETLSIASRYYSLLFAAAENKLDLSASEHKMLYYQIEQLVQHYSMIEIFYEFMQTAELFMHYAALCVIAASNEINTDFVELSLGKMTELISKEKRLFSPGIYGISDMERDKQIRTELQKAGNFFTNKVGIRITTKRTLFRYTFDLIVQIRNRYLGHGALAYYVSEDMLCAFIPIASAVIAECIDIISSHKISGGLCNFKLTGTDEQLALMYMKNIYLYSKKVENSGTEYINPITGSFYRTYTTESISLKWNENVKERGCE